MKIEMERTEGGAWDVRVGHLSERELSRDEALGVVASILFGDPAKPLYLRNPIQHLIWDSHYNQGPPQLPEKVSQ